MKKTISFESYDSKVNELTFKKGISLETTLDILNMVYDVKPRSKCKNCDKNPPLKDNCYCSDCWKEIEQRLQNRVVEG